MEILISTIKFALAIALIACPILILNKLYKRNSNYTFITYLLLSTVVTFLLVIILAWWSDYSCQLLLSNYGYDLETLIDTERFNNVAIENLNRVKELDKSRMGIGWPLKALIFYPFYFPYLLLVYVANHFYKKYKTKTN